MTVNNQNTGAFQKAMGLYEVPILEYWQQKYVDSIKESMIPMLFSRVNSNNPSEAISEQVGKVTFNKWQGEFNYYDLKDGSARTWTPVPWEAGLAYDRFTLSNIKLINLQNDTSHFAIEAARFRERCAAGIFTYADQTSFSVDGNVLDWTRTANGLPLASNAQTSSNYSTTQDNLESLELNEENLEILCQKMFDLKDENGREANLQPDCLVVPTALRKKALELIGGEGKVDTSDNNPNIYNGSMKLMVWKNFRRQAGKTGQPWAVIDYERAKEAMKWINRLESGEDFEVTSNKDWKNQKWELGSIMWFSAGPYSFHPFQFSIPA